MFWGANYTKEALVWNGLAFQSGRGVFLVLNVASLFLIYTGFYSDLNIGKKYNFKKQFWDIYRKSINIAETCFYTNNPTNIPRIFHVETTWKRSFPRRFNVDYTWCVYRVKEFVDDICEQFVQNVSKKLFHKTTISGNVLSSG